MRLKAQTIRRNRLRVQCSVQFARETVARVSYDMHGTRQALVVLLLFGRLQRVPLRDRPPRVREHIHPVLELAARRAHAEYHLPDRVRAAHPVVVHDCQDQLHLLRASSRRIRK